MRETKYLMLKLKKINNFELKTNKFSKFIKLFIIERTFCLNLIAY